LATRRTGRAAGFFEGDELLDQIITGYYQQYLTRSPTPAAWSTGKLSVGVLRRWPRSAGLERTA